MGWLLLNGHVELDELMFDHLIFSPFAVMVVFVRAKVSDLPRIFDDVVIQ